MEREQHQAQVIELGTASIETRGQPIPTALREKDGYVFMGLLED
jgi:hypothetical protein